MEHSRLLHGGAVGKGWLEMTKDGRSGDPFTGFGSLMCRSGAQALIGKTERKASLFDFNITLPRRTRSGDWPLPPPAYTLFFFVF